MAFGRIVCSQDRFDIDWKNEHCVKDDMCIIGHLNVSSLLYFSYTASMLAIYDIVKMES
jgi:hypothetical protein